MKTGIRKLYYNAGGGAEYQEHVEIWHCYYSGRRVRRMTKHIDIDCDDIE